MKRKQYTWQEWVCTRLRGFFIQAMRRRFLFSPLRAEALKRARVEEKGKTLYRCAISKKLYTVDQVKVDHRDPVVDPKTGWVDYNTFMARLFCSPDNLQIISKVEHEKKTKKEQKERKLRKKK